MSIVLFASAILAATPAPATPPAPTKPAPRFDITPGKPTSPFRNAFALPTEDRRHRRRAIVGPTYCIIVDIIDYE